MQSDQEQNTIKKRLRPSTLEDDNSASRRNYNAGDDQVEDAKQVLHQKKSHVSSPEDQRSGNAPEVIKVQSGTAAVPRKSNWNKKERIRYMVFVSFYSEIPHWGSDLKSIPTYKSLSVFVKTRSPEQSKSFHLSMKRQYEDAEELVGSLFEELREEENFQKLLDRYEAEIIEYEDQHKLLEYYELEAKEYFKGKSQLKTDSIENQRQNAEPGASLPEQHYLRGLTDRPSKRHHPDPSSDSRQVYQPKINIKQLMQSSDHQLKDQNRDPQVETSKRISSQDRQPVSESVHHQSKIPFSDPCETSNNLHADKKNDLARERFQTNPVLFNQGLNPPYIPNASRQNQSKDKQNTFPIGGNFGIIPPQVNLGGNLGPEQLGQKLGLMGGNFMPPQIGFSQPLNRGDQRATNADFNKQSLQGPGNSIGNSSQMIGSNTQKQPMRVSQEKKLVLDKCHTHFVKWLAGAVELQKRNSKRQDSRMNPVLSSFPGLMGNGLLGLNNFLQGKPQGALQSQLMNPAFMQNSNMNQPQSKKQGP